jgi:hypothetical protein
MIKTSKKIFCSNDKWQTWHANSCHSHHLGRNMALSVDVEMTSGKLLCIVGTLFLLTFERIVVKDINSRWTLNHKFNVVLVSG